MRFTAPAYLAWAQRLYGKVPFDLASSGMPTAPLSDLGPVPAILDDVASWTALPIALSRAVGVPAEEIAPALGTSHAIFLACQAVLSPGDHVLVETPVYEPLVLVPRALGAEVDFFDRARGALDVEAILSKLTPRTRLVAVSNLHNPTGVRAPDAVLAELARRLGDVPLLVDEVYAPFDALLVDGRLPRSARVLAPNILAISSLTKAYGTGPHRVGWVAAAPEIARRAAHAVTSTLGLLPVSHAALSVHILSKLEVLATRTARLLSSKREIVTDWIARRSLDWTAPAEGLFGLVYLHGARDLLTLVEDGARDHGVLVAPGDFFGATNAFRLAWSLPEASLVEGLLRLERVLAKLP